MDKYVCPLCGSSYKYEGISYANRTTSCWREYGNRFGRNVLNCKHLNLNFSMESYILDDMEHETELREKLLNLACEHALHANYCMDKSRKLRWHFYYDDNEVEPPKDQPECFNLARKLKSYPTNVVDLANRCLVNLGARYPEYGGIIGADRRDHRLFFQEGYAGSTGPFLLLNDFGYVKESKHEGCYVITANGWLKIDDLKKQEQVVRQGFIAMAFREETKPIREAFRKAITEMGYNASVIDEKEHNNQIVPEIFYEIQRSKFVVVDVTYPNLGAYYEAGYAQALGKQVIICCQEDSFKDSSRRPHFDISQKSMIVWTDEADLVRRLKRRIEATVQ